MQIYRKKIFIFFGCLLLILSLFTQTQANIIKESRDSSEFLVLTYTFDTPTINTIIKNNQEYQQITIPALELTGKPGEPLLPAQEVSILLPQGTTVAKVQVTTRDPVCLGKNILIEHAPEMKVFSQISEPTSSPKTIGRSSLSTTVLESIFTQSGIYSLRGYSVLIGKLLPVQIIKSTNELQFFKEITLTIHLTPTETSNVLFRGTVQDKQKIMDRVDNPEDILTYEEPAQTSAPEDVYDLLIITNDLLKNNFLPLQLMHNQTGTLTRIKTLSDIAEGSATKEQIRDFIRNEYLQHNISYVLLGGDAEIIPAHLIFCGYSPQYPGGPINAPADLYYGCLDGEGPGSADDEDLLAEVYVGRAPVSTSSEAWRFVTKTIGYMNTEDEYLQQALMVGEWVGFGGIVEYAGPYMDELIDGSDAHNYTTVGIPSDEFTITTLYDHMTDTATEYLWPLSDLYDSINSGIHLVNHLGHGWYDHTMKMDIPDLDGLVNTKHCFVYSQCCMAGGFDNPEGYDCIAEHLMVKNMHGAFAGIWNSRFGVGAIESTDGASQRYHREFIDAIFGEHKLRLGAANHDSKEDNLWRIDEDEQWMRLCYYQTNLFGDPAVCFHINLLPETPSCPVGPQTGKSGISYQFETSSVDPLNESLYYQWDWGDGELSEWMGPYKSGTPCVISHIWLSLGINTVKVRARNAMIYPCSTWSVERNVTIYDYDVNDDGLVNPVDVGYVKMFYGYNTSIDAYAIYDVNFDDQIDPKDVGLIKFYYGPWP